MKFRPVFAGLLSLMAVSCSIDEIDRPENAVPDSEEVFYVTIGEQPDADTKVYTDESLHIKWNADDRFTIFNKKTYNREFRFAGQDGDTSGQIEQVGPDGTGETLDRIYAVYPYSESTDISTSGTITYTLPAEQSYRAGSFGIDANVMVSVTDNTRLRFKNAGGYLSFKFYGEGVSVSSITLKGNDGELLSGPCTILTSGEDPVLTMSQGAGNQVTMVCDPPVALGSTASSAVQFIFVLPPVTFTKGISIMIMTSDGKVSELSAASQRTITRSSILKFSAIKVEPSAWETSAEAVSHLGVGWNLGNTLDANSFYADDMFIEATTSCTVTDYETALGQPVTTRELIHMFKEAGFGAIMIPVTWYPHMGNFRSTVSGNPAHWDMSAWTGYDVDPKWMARVKEVVDYVIDEGMYCILNVAHDTGEHSAAWMKASTDSFNSNKERFGALWTQIAEVFKYYGPKLLFESFNEMVDPAGTWNHSSQEAHNAVNNYNAEFVAKVRATGGNNVYRNLVLPTYAAGYDSYALDRFRLPSGSDATHLMAAFHSYAPYDFAFGQNNHKTFTASDAKDVNTIMERAYEYMIVKKGIPCILSEFGTFISEPIEEELSKHAACFYAAGARLGIPCFYWMVLSDGADRSVPKWTMPILKDAIFDAWNNGAQN